MHSSKMRTVRSSGRLPGGVVVSARGGVCPGGMCIPACAGEDTPPQGSHFFGLTKFHDISMIFSSFLASFQVFFHYF